MQVALPIFLPLLTSSLLGVGKSSILLRFVTQDFKENPDPTLGAAFMSKLFDYHSTPIKYQVHILLFSAVILLLTSLVHFRFGTQLGRRNTTH